MENIDLGFLLISYKIIVCPAKCLNHSGRISQNPNPIVTLKSLFYAFESPALIGQVGLVMRVSVRRPTRTATKWIMRQFSGH